MLTILQSVPTCADLDELYSVALVANAEVRRAIIQDTIG